MISMQPASLSRRQFCKTTAIGAAGVGLLPRMVFGQSSAPCKPNILFMHMDQLYLRAIAAHGCHGIHTPNMDRLIKSGVSFLESYSADPVCCPARAAWYTGRAPCENGVVSNDWPIVDDMPDLGQWFRAHGYESVYTGKWHVPARDVAQSFKVLGKVTGSGEYSDAAISRAAAGFLQDYRGDKPFFLSVSLVQPHDICYWVFAHIQALEELPYPLIEAELPPIWDNWKFDPREPETVRGLWRDENREWPKPDKWAEWQWRYYRWSYFRHIEMVDAEIGRVLDALEDSGYAKNTAVVFTADHGDGMGAHQLWQKNYFYEEAAQVPLVISWPGHLPEDVRDGKHLVSGLDITPTLCEIAGIEAPPKYRGRSLMKLARQEPVDWRDFLVCEASITGRMVRTADYKLITYKGDPTGQLFDMRTDRGEMHNLAPDGQHADTMAAMQKMLADWESQLEPISLEGRNPKAKGAVKKSKPAA
jgi:arylsulfatase A-like enzyme